MTKRVGPFPPSEVEKREWPSVKLQMSGVRKHICATDEQRVRDFVRKTWGAKRATGLQAKFVVGRMAWVKELVDLPGRVQ